MHRSYSKIAVGGLLLLCLAATARIGFVMNSVRQKSGGNSPASEALFHPSEAVLQFLNATNPAPPSLDGKFPCIFANVKESALTPEIGRCSLPLDRSGPVDRFEADLRFGNFILRQSDLYLNDVFDVPLTRTYNSGDYIHPNRVHAFGKNANHPFDIAPLGSRYPYTYQMLVLEDGNFLYSGRVSPGTSYSDAIYQHTETSTGFYKAITGWNGQGWTIWQPDGSAMTFPEAYAAKNMAQGAVTGIRDAAGNRLQLVRDAQRNLQEIRTPHDHTIKFRYDDQSRIVHAVDDQGHSAEYRYDGNGMLVDATLSSGASRHYSYNGDLVTSIEDEHQHDLLRNSYDGRQLTQQDFGNGQVYSYSYTSSTGAYNDSVEVTLPNGSKTVLETASAVPDAVKNPPR